jgi:hypothetical protein
VTSILKQAITGRKPSGPVYPNQPLNKQCRKLKLQKGNSDPIDRVNLLQLDYEYNRDGQYRKLHNSAHAMSTSPPTDLSVYENQCPLELNISPNTSPSPTPQLNAPQDRQHWKGARESKYDETGKALSQSATPVSWSGNEKALMSSESRRCAKVDGEGRGNRGLTIGRAWVGRGFLTEGHTSGREGYTSVGPSGQMEGSYRGREGVEVDISDEAQDTDDAVQGPTLKEIQLIMKETRTNRNLPTKKNGHELLN